MDYELLRNGSGYVDPTAYEALKNFKGVNKTMNDFRKGEIYEVETLHGYRKALILSAEDREDNRYVNIIVMNENQMFDNEIPIVCRGIMFASCEKISLTHRDKIGNFIKIATDDEMAQIDAGIARSLGIEPKTEYITKEIQAAEPESNEVKKAEDEEAGYIKLTVAEFEEMVASKTEAELKAKIYKDLHEKLLDKVMQG